MAAKLPVVATWVGDNGKIIKNGYNGYLVAPGEIMTLAQVIIKVLKSPNLNQWGINGYQLVKKYYSWEKCARETYGIYQQIVDQGQSN
jgi:glycosyltransferase involved in cell wall biosynthesis